MRKYVSYGLAVILLLCHLYECDKNADLQDLANDNYAALIDTTAYFKNKLGLETASKKALQLDKNQMQALLIKNDVEMAAMAAEFNKVKSVTKFSSVVKFDTIYTPFKDTIPFVFTRKDSIRDKWYSFNYEVDQRGLQLNDFSTWTDTRIVTGFKRKWFLGKQTLVTDITNTNPNIKVTDITAAETLVLEPWYKKWYFWLGVGVASRFILK